MEHNKTSKSSTKTQQEIPVYMMAAITRKNKLIGALLVIIIFQLCVDIIGMDLTVVLLPLAAPLILTNPHQCHNKWQKELM